MGFFRLLKQSIIFGTRSRRLFIFIFIFAILTGVTLFAMDSIFQENSTELLSTKSIVLQASDLEPSFEKRVNTTFANQYADDMTDDEDVGSFYVTRYVTIFPEFYLFSLSSNVWENPEVQPNDIKEGKYVSNFDEVDGMYQVLISAGFNSNYSLGNSSYPYSVTQDSTIGNVLNFGYDSDLIFQSEIVGIFNKSTTIDSFSSDKAWIFIPDRGFDDIVETIFSSTERDTNVFVSHIVLTAGGSTEFFFGLFGGNANDNLDKIDQNVKTDPRAQNIKFELQNSVDTTQVRAAATQKDIFLLFGGIGSTIVATMYAFIIARFRTREIATLKAVGYTARQVRVVLLAEIGTVSLIGYIVSTFIIQVLLTLNAQTTLGSTWIPDIWIFWNIITDPLGYGWFPSTTAIFTFMIVVLSNVIGFFIISKRTVAVRPVELFRADA
ncbi:MAG: FtsX-like permease family protein [Candidatus Hodarchaeales archaeon]|jgi:ABC-type antimicrobial peptide transport system permease subunit